MHLQLEGQLAHDVVALGAHNVPGLDAVDHGAPLCSPEGDAPLRGLLDTAFYFLYHFLHSKNFKIFQLLYKVSQVS